MSKLIHLQNLATYVTVALVGILYLFGWIPAAAAQNAPIVQRIDSVQYIYLIATVSENSEVFSAEFSERRLNNPDITEFRFWALEHGGNPELSDFLINRPLACILVYIENGIGTVDCLATPDRNPDELLTGFLKEWIPLFVWLPEFGLAKQRCSDTDILHRSFRSNKPLLSLLCQANYSPNRATYSLQ
ncbi:hypothetical protein MNBD_ALPHA07-1082 [hydrothermal vent metagenome]|uniref:Uncharacterized protein n=1 Tax=hydrothermal vent metagenome TaxID=652676 RepID=A0A3B0S9D1_9ZZZZ